MPEAEDELLERAVRGDPDALGVLYRTFSPRVAGYLRSRGAEDVDGLTSEVFLQVFRRLDAVHGGYAGLRTFVFSVAHARLVDELRARQRRPRPVSYDDIDDLRTSESAEDEAIDNDAARRAVAMLRLLNDDQRAVLTLRIVGDLSIDETASALGRSTGSVKQLQRRGLLALRRLVQDEVST